MIKFLSEKFTKSFGVAILAGFCVVAEAQNLNWAPAGPVLTAGRIRNMVVDKADPSGNTLYVGSTSSGVFKSVDGGTNWYPLNDQGTVRNISYMAQGADGKIYAATGEGFLRASQKAKALPGTGLYNLSNGNLVQIADASKTGSVITKIACHPVTPGIIVITSEKGVLTSTDSGVNWVNASGTPTDQPGLDVKFNPNGILYCSCGSELANGTLGLTPSTVWMANGSNPVTASFTDITPMSGVVTNTLYGRIELAIAPSNPNVIYASCAAKANAGVVSSSTLAGLFVSYDAGQTWGVVVVGSAQMDPLYSGTTRSSGDYAHCIFIEPTNSDIIQLGSYQLYQFARTGGTNTNPVGNWTKLGYDFAFNSQLYLHENIHDIKKIGSAYYYVTDAGIYRTIDNGLSFQPFYRGLVTGQFNSVSIERYPLNNTPAVNGSSVTPYIGFIGGTGGNGAIYFKGVTSGTNINVNKEVATLGGDIFSVDFSKILPSAAYITGGNGALYRTSDAANAYPAQIDLVANTVSQTVISFANGTYSVTGSPYKLWENYGQTYRNQTIKSPDSLVFYNDTSFALAAIPAGSITSATNFTFTIGRPQKNAVIDFITVRTTTVKVAATTTAVTVTGYSVVNTKTMSIQCDPTFTLPAPGTAVAHGTASIPVTTVTGYYTGTPQVIVDSYSDLDQIQIQLAGPLFTTQPTTAPSVTNVESYVRLKATVYYRYKQNDSIQLLDDNISTMGTVYNVKVNQNLAWTQPPSDPQNLTTNKIQKYEQKRSARLAVSYLNGGVYVSRTPLDLNSPISLVKVSAHKAVSDYSNGSLITNSATPLPTVAVWGRPTIIEWSKSGTDLFYATDSNRVYRVSHIYTIMDSTSKCYSGKLYSGIFKYGSAVASPTNAFTPTLNPSSTIRTTYLGSFGKKKITSINVSANDSVVALTFDCPTRDTLVMTNSFPDIRNCDSTNVGWTNRTGTGMTNLTTYCALLAKSNYKNAFIGTDAGMYYTDDITNATPTWSNVNNGQLPNVQIFDIKQQTMAPWECYNSGQIYVATNGRGIWTTNKYYSPTLVSVKEIVASASTSNLSVYPNPTTGELNITFRAFDDEKAVMNIIDINGRVVMSDNLGRLNNGDTKHSADVSSLAAGMYIVNVTSDSGIRRVSKLVITK
jgi:hypothetical protein